MPHQPEVLNHEATPALEAATGELRVLGGLPVRGSVVLDYKKSETSNGVDVQPDQPRPEVAKLESETERERREAYEEYHERLRIPEELRHQAMEALRRTLAACREEFVGFDEQLVAQATARLMAIIDDTPLPPKVLGEQDSSASISPAEWVVRERLHQKLLNVREGSVYKALNFECDDGRETREAALRAMKHHPLYQVFEATISQSEKPDSRKRTQFELQTALAQAEQEVKRRYGISSQDDLRLHHGARRAFERQAWQIEDEDIPHTRSDKDEDHSKVFNFFVNMLPDEKRSEFRRLVGLLKAKLPREGAKVAKYSGTTKPLLDQLTEAIDAYETSSTKGYEEVDFLVKRFMKTRAMVALFQELQYQPLASSDYLLTARSLDLVHEKTPAWTVQEDTYAQRARRILDERVDRPDLLLRDRIAFPTQSPGVSELRFSVTYAERVRQNSLGSNLPLAVVNSLDAQDYGSEPDRAQEIAQKGTWSLSGHNFYVQPDAVDSGNYDFSTLENQPPLAKVYYTDAFPAGVPRAMRLIQPTQMPDMNDVSRVRNHMVVELQNGFLPTADNAFTVAGFDLEWASNGRLHFAYDADHDPYVPARTPLPEGSVDRLIAAYKEAGLDELARLVDQASVRTIDQLEYVLKWGADYAQKGNGVRVTTKTLTELAEAYKTDEGRPSYQCTGAAQLLRLSLQEIYGPGSTSIITGSVLASRSDTIGVIGHAQVKFVSPEDGRVYYLDATPSGSAINVVEATENEETDEAIHSQAPTAEESIGWLEQAKVLFEEDKLKAGELDQVEGYTRAEADALVTTIRESRFLPMVGAWLNIQPTNKKSRDELYRKLLDLQKGDPLRSTLELTHQIPAGTAEPSQLARLKTLLDTIRQHPANSPLFKRIRHYSRPQLDALSDIVSEVEAVYAGVASTTED